MWVGCAQLTRYQSGPPSSASTRSMACPSGVPSGSRPSVSTVNEIATGRPTRRAARTTPTASSGPVSVYADTTSAPASAKDSICAEW